MVNYNNGKIYKIVPKCGDDIVYIGSTTKQFLSQRMSQHRSGYNRWKECKCNKTTAYELFDVYGVENCEIMLIELVNCNSKDELYARERFWIESTNCVNKNIAGRTKVEYQEANREKIKEYRETNREKTKEYREANREKLKQQHHERYVANREEIKEYYKANCERIREHQQKCNEANIEKRREYYEANRETKKEYNEANREKIKQQKRNWYEANREKINNKHNEYRQLNHEIILKKAHDKRGQP